MSLFKKSLIMIFSLIIIWQLFFVVFRPVLVNLYITAATKYARGQFVCTLDKNGRHVGKLYKFNKDKKELIHTSTSSSCIFSRPKINTGFFVFAIGGGGGATPYESGKSGQIVSKHIRITNPVIAIKIGKGGKGTHMEGTAFVDAKDGADTIIPDLKIIAHGGSKSTRMTPLGEAEKQPEYHIPDRYHQLYDISKSAKYGVGGKSDGSRENVSEDLHNGHSGAVVIQW